MSGVPSASSSENLSYMSRFAEWASDEQVQREVKIAALLIASFACAYFHDLTQPVSLSTLKGICSLGMLCLPFPMLGLAVFEMIKLRKAEEAEQTRPQRERQQRFENLQQILARHNLAYDTLPRVECPFYEKYAREKRHEDNLTPAHMKKSVMAGTSCKQAKFPFLAFKLKDLQTESKERVLIVYLDDPSKSYYRGAFFSMHFADQSFSSRHEPISTLTIDVFLEQIINGFHERFSLAE